MILRQRNAREIQVWTPAKLNLFLEIQQKRPDGYHELETVMVAVSLYDTLLVREVSRTGIQVASDWSELPAADDNLIVRAARLFCRELRWDGGVEVWLSKRIPDRAGLGGGSSDAAAILVALNRLRGNAFTREALSAMCAEIGSDVSFFLSGPLAVARGRGEKISGLALRQRLHFVLAVPRGGVSTGELYRRLKVPEKPKPVQPVLDALANPAGVGAVLFNRLESYAEQMCPEIARVRDEMKAIGLGQPIVTGSGSTVFAMVPDRNAALRAARGLRNRQLEGVTVVSSTPVASQ